MSKRSDAPTAPAGEDWGDAPVALGATMGRYQLRTLLGAGGMGVVFEALDPELARSVAVKVMRTTEDTEGAARLRREGQTMAQLAHPNVIRIYDVGVDHGHAFVAMELVRGTTLGGWLDAAPRTVAEILAVYGDAGRGLAAAHAAGLVHRDFKPGNVLVGVDGRVLVTDFGLARAAGPAPDAIGAAVTQTGHFVGTPAYMAPEQYSSRDVDARADQFSFCVSLWRALYGAPPYAGVSIDELVTAAEANRIVPPPATTAARAPRAVRAALERGLRGAPAERFPSMAALLAALEPRPARRTARGLVAGGAVIAAGITAWVIATREPAATATAPIRGGASGPVAALAPDATAPAPPVVIDAAPIAAAPADAAPAPAPPIDARRPPPRPRPNPAPNPAPEPLPEETGEIPDRMGETYAQTKPVLEPILKRAQRCGPWTTDDNYEARFDIDSHGVVTNLEVTGPDASIAACMKGLLARAKFGRSKFGGNMSIGFRR